MTCKHLMSGIEDCVFCQRDRLQQEVNCLLVENANLRGVRDQLLKDDGETIEQLRATLLSLSVSAQRISEEAALALARVSEPQPGEHKP